MKKKRIVLPVCILAGLAVICLGVYGLMQYWGSSLLPGSLERRYAREVAAHGEELEQAAQVCLETGTAPPENPLPGLVKEVVLAGSSQGDLESAFVEFACDGWGLVPSSSYYGFYYSPQGPRAFQGVEVELTPQDGGYVWQGEGDNYGFTREIQDGFYYYEAHF